MPQAGFEPMTPVFEWVKTVHALDCVVTVIGGIYSYHLICYFIAFPRWPAIEQESLSSTGEISLTSKYHK
jgi:hypothetical protein